MNVVRPNAREAMTDDQYSELMKLLMSSHREILSLAIRVMELEKHLGRQDEQSSRHFEMLTEWCAPDEYKMVSTAVEIDIPEDLKKFFPHRLED